MTGEQKQQIYLLRKTGASFGDISAKLGLPRNTVKTFCWRNGLSDAELAAPQENKGYMGFCKNCGKQLDQQAKSRPKKFCCDKCRLQWWTANSGQLNRKTLLTLVCANCGAEFSCYASQKRRYCGHGCYIAHRYHSEGGATHDAD